MPEAERVLPGENSLRSGLGGFTLIEILAALVLTGLLLSGLSLLTGGMLTGWVRSAALHEDLGSAMVAMDRLAEEYEGALVIYSEPEGAPVTVFSGQADAFTMARPAIGFETVFDADRVTYRIEPSSAGVQLVRYSSRLPLAAPDRSGADGTRTVMAEIAGSMRFAYSGDGRGFSPVWTNEALMPRALQVVAELSGSGPTQLVRTAFRVNDVSPACVADYFSDICTASVEGE